MKSGSDPCADSFSGSKGGQHSGDPPADVIVHSVSFIRKRRAWPPRPLFRRHFPQDCPSFDNQAPERLDRIVTVFSRAVGPVMLVAALAATAWLTYDWLQ